MKRMIAAFLLSLMAMTFFAACEKADYQNPFHRSSQQK